MLEVNLQSLTLKLEYVFLQRRSDASLCVKFHKFLFENILYQVCFCMPLINVVISQVKSGVNFSDKMSLQS